MSLTLKQKLSKYQNNNNSNKRGFKEKSSNRFGNSFGRNKERKSYHSDAPEGSGGDSKFSGRSEREGNGGRFFDHKKRDRYDGDRPNNGFNRSNSNNFRNKTGSFSDQRRQEDKSFGDDDNRKNRLAKHLAMLGVLSKRDAEQAILDGKIKVNNIICKDLVTLVDYSDSLQYNNKVLHNKPIRTKIYLMNKPAGYICSNFDPEGRKTIFDLIPNKLGRLVSVGRLDYNTDGLILLTNNGEVARTLELPSNHVKRVYKVTVFGPIDKDRLEKTRDGITVDGMKYGKFTIIINRVNNTGALLTVIIYEGKNHEIKKIMSHFGLKVTRLTRVQYGDYYLTGIPSGCVVESKHRFDINRYRKYSDRDKFPKKHDKGSDRNLDKAETQATRKKDLSITNDIDNCGSTEITKDNPADDR